MCRINALPLDPLMLCVALPEMMERVGKKSIRARKSGLLTYRTGMNLLCIYIFS